MACNIDGCECHGMYDALCDMGLFCYASNGDGDLFRKNRTKGVRVVACWCGLDLQERGRGGYWASVASYSTACNRYDFMKNDPARIEKLSDFLARVRELLDAPVALTK